MRIDDDNKVVWCSEGEMEWYVSFNYSRGNCLASNMLRISVLSTEKAIRLTFARNMAERIEIIKAISDNYEFKLEQPKEYYWRKKKEYLAWFEKVEDNYLAKDFIGLVSLSNLDDEGTYKYFKFSEDLAKQLLKDNFDMFEKVEGE